MITFDTIFLRVIGSEGGYTNNPKDAGNWTGGKVGVGELKGTKYGLAAHSYPHLDIKNITMEQAKDIYREWYTSGKIDQLPSVIQYQMFDARFNHGAKWANKILQRAVGVTDDGIIGKNTMKAVHSMNENDLVLKFIQYRIKFYTDLRSFSDFGRGWMRRMSEALGYAALDN